MFVYDWDQILVIAVILFTFMRILLRYKFSQLINTAEIIMGSVEIKDNKIDSRFTSFTNLYWIQC